MDRSAKQRIGAASVVAGLVLSAALAVSSPWASAESGAPVEATSADAAQCGGPIELPSPDAEILELMQQDLDAGRQQPGATPESDYVVLNGRGYNYGPPPGVSFETLIRDLAPNADEGAR